jgi:hypothetical protein
MEILYPLRIFAPPRDMRGQWEQPSAEEGAICARAIVSYMHMRALLESKLSESVLLAYLVLVPLSPHGKKQNISSGCCIACGSFHSNYMFTATCARCHSDVGFRTNLCARVANKAAQEIGSAEVLELLEVWEPKRRIA